MYNNDRRAQRQPDRPSGFVVSAAWLYALSLLLIAVVFSSGCSDEKSVSPFEVLPDTSFFRIMDVGYRAVCYSDPLNSGVHIWWKEYFFSNYDKNCGINRYVVVNDRADTIYDHVWTNRIIHHGDTNIGRTKWIDLADSVVEGRYTLSIFYHHSRRSHVFDTTFSIFANYP